MKSPLGEWIRLGLTAVILVVWSGFMILVILNIMGGVTADQWSRGKDVIGWISPVLTLALGYWFGVKGADAATKQADTATASAKTERAVSTTLAVKLGEHLPSDEVAQIVGSARNAAGS